MLDFFTIFSKGGILLWCFNEIGLAEKELKGFTPAVNTFIKTVLLQEKTGGRNLYESGSLAIKYKLDNEFELVFVVGYQKMLPLLYLDKLLDEIQLRFRDKFNTDLKEKNYFNRETYSNFTSDFDRILRAVENATIKTKATGQKMKTFEESAKSQKTIASLIENPTANNSVGNNNNSKKVSIAAEPVIAFKENIEPTLEEEMKAKNQVKVMRTGPGKKAEKMKSPKAEKATGKKKTTWDPFIYGGPGATGEEAKNLERGPKSPKAGSNESNAQEDLQLQYYVPDKSAIGHSAQIAELDVESEGEEEEYALATEKKAATSTGGLWSSLSSLVGSKSLTRADIEPVISKMQDHLIGKNVASDVAAKLCESVASKLEGKVMGTFQSIHRTVKDVLTESLLALLTPKRRIDILRDIVSSKKAGKPFVITFCGVNGVGKSTNLAKICFWLVENKCSVLIAACDTFRAGAVEQLRTHMRRLNSLHPSAQGEKQSVELYEKGYGKDAAGIAMEAINYARTSKIDVVLVDTAGRMQDNGPLMRALAKLIAVNDPDLVLFVGEALVGNEAVDQLVKFNAALADNSSHENPHLIDGIVLTKFDTIDDKVGSAISMTYITGQPIIFVGTGQTYTDLKNLNAKAVVQALMK